jgi:hypothetical protein
MFSEMDQAEPFSSKKQKKNIAIFGKLRKKRVRVTNV